MPTQTETDRVNPRVGETKGGIIFCGQSCVFLFNQWPGQGKDTESKWCESNRLSFSSSLDRRHVVDSRVLRRWIINWTVSLELCPVPFRSLCHFRWPLQGFPSSYTCNFLVTDSMIVENMANNWWSPGGTTNDERAKEKVPPGELLKPLFCFSWKQQALKTTTLNSSFWKSVPLSPH